MAARRILLVSALAWAACTADPYEGDFEALGPVATRDGLAWIDQRYGDALFVLPGDDAIDSRRTPIADARAKVSWVAPMRDGEGVLVMRVPASDTQEDVREQLVRLSSDGRDEPVVYDVLAPFTHVALSPDRRRAVLHFGGESGSGMLQNANQVAIVDLLGDGVRNLTLDGFGGRLLSVQFPSQGEDGGGAPVMVGGQARDIVAFLAEGEVVLVDADDALADQVAVRFAPEVELSPAATLLRPGNDMYQNAALFLRATAGPDVAMLTLVDHPDGAVAGFSAQVSLVPVGVAASDFTLFDSAQAPYLVTLEPDSAVVFTDIRTQQGFAVDLDGAATRLYVRRHDTGAGIIDQLVMWSEDGNAVFTLDLDGIEDAVGRTPERLSMQGSIDALVRLDNDRALVGAGELLYVLDFPEEQVTPLQAMSPYDPTFSAIDGERLLLGTPGQTWLSTVDLVTLDPESMALDDAIVGFHYIAAAGKIVVTHEDPAGHLTVVDANEPTRATSYVAWGFLHEHMLDRGGL